MQIYGFNKTTLLDYPKHLAATIFLGGCNMRCPFCHNASLVTRLSTQPMIPVDEVLSHLKKRKGILEGVCITGGEPTLYSDLPDFMEEIKSFGYNIKLDTNGTQPDLLKNLIQNKLIDYIAMDIKNSPNKYSLSVGITNFDLTKINESISYLLTNPIKYEFRTTVVQEHHTKDDMMDIGKWIQGTDAYYLQSYKDSGDILSPGLHSHSKDTLYEFADLLSPYVKQVSVRGID